jgi:pimeloyl-ACP methyl ester carboxylesterase
MVLNAGVLHRVGPHRLHVKLARQLARRGLLTVRLDLGGLGDSPASASAGTFTESAVADVRAAMTDLERRFGARRFVIFGLCSGADNGLAAALEDERIAGLVLLDPHSYRTRRSSLRKIRERVTAMGNPVTVARWGLGMAARLVRQQAVARVTQLRARLAGGGAGEVEEAAPGREAPPVAVFRERLTRLADRGVKILAVYSGAYGDRYNHRDQLFEICPELRGRIDHEYFRDANHMFTELAAQETLLAVVTTWLARHFVA